MCAQHPPSSRQSRLRQPRCGRARLRQPLRQDRRRRPLRQRLWPQHPSRYQRHTATCAAFWPCLTSSPPCGPLRPLPEYGREEGLKGCSVVSLLAAGLLKSWQEQRNTEGLSGKSASWRHGSEDSALQVVSDVQRPPAVPSSAGRAQQLPPASSQDFASRFRCKCVYCYMSGRTYT